MGKRQLVVSFTHTNYTIKNGGTEKFVTELSDILSSNSFCHLSFFPFMKRKTIAGKPIVGANFNDQFVGVYFAKDIPDIIRYYLNKYDLLLNCFHIHHLKRHSISDVLSAILSFEADIVIFIHDFYFVCCSEHFIDSNGSYCGSDRATKEKCCKCAFFHDEQIHQKMMDDFVENLRDRIKAIICPSEYVRMVIKKAFPELSDMLCTRPHLVFSGNKTVDLIHQVNIAFLGRKRKQKGYDKWEEIIKHIEEETAYKFKYLGVDVENDTKVENIYVSTTLQGMDAMKEAINQEKINCAFLWPQCPETYSYVYYELLMSGVFIITNSISGNIKDEVIGRQNGMIFSSIDECIKWLKDAERVKSEINKYRSKAIIPEVYSTNIDISKIVGQSNITDRIINKGRNALLPLSTLLYRIKYHKIV